MSKQTICLVTLVLSCLAPKVLAAESKRLVFICHKGLNYSMQEVQFAFKGYLDEPRPIDNRPLFKEMLNFIGYTDLRYKRVWSKMFFRRGLFKPRVVATDEEVIQWVSASYAGVGYVSVAPQDHPNVEICGNEE